MYVYLLLIAQPPLWKVTHFSYCLWSLFVQKGVWTFLSYSKLICPLVTEPVFYQDKNRSSLSVFEPAIRWMWNEYPATMPPPSCQELDSCGCLHVEGVEAGLIVWHVRVDWAAIINSKTREWAWESERAAPTMQPHHAPTLPNLYDIHH